MKDDKRKEQYKIMQKKKWIIIVTAVGLLGTSAAVGARSLVSKVNGVLHEEVVVSVNGTDTTLHPVYIDGKAYLPARDTVDALGYSLNWSNAGKEIVLSPKAEQAAPVGKLTAEAAQQYREAAWLVLDDSQKAQLKTSKDEALVSIISAQSAEAILTASDAAKKRLVELQAANSMVIQVSYTTDKDELLGPLTMVIDPETKTLLGYFPRR
jgi:hypothetical protein